MPQTKINQEAVLTEETESPNLSLLALGKSESQAMFVVQRWHRLYAVALIESDPALLPEAVALAEQAVLVRFLELFVARSETEETIELRRAMAALSELEAEIAIGCLQQEQYVAGVSA
jgi:hypothetical protein